MRKPLTIKQFQELYPHEDACLDYMFYGETGQTPKHCCQCKKETKFYRVKGRKCYECGDCGHQIYPLANTIFRGMKGSITDAFIIIHRFGTNHSLSVQQIMDEFGYTYKKAWALCHKVRRLMKEDLGPSKGFDEVDETMIGGKRKRGGVKGKSDERECVFGIKNRENKTVKAYVIKNAEMDIVLPIILKEVSPGSIIHSDEAAIYTPLTGMGFIHKFITHKPKKMEDGTVRKRRFRNGNVTTNGIESFWSHLKRFIFGKHLSVSPKYLQRYVDERAFRQNWKDKREQITPELLSRLRSGFGTDTRP